jgi:hypothetical protein
MTNATTGMQPMDEARDLAKMVESMVMRGDISALSPEHRVRFYVQTCEGLGLNPHSQPFAFLKLNGKEVMYATRGATDQLAAMHRINRRIIDGPKIVDIAGAKVAYCVAEATHPNGRTETATATLPVSDPPNLYMKLETKAKRRVTLSILGLGLLDETEVDSIPGAVRVDAPVATVQRDDAPAQLAAPDDLAAFRAALDGAESLDLDGARVAYARHDLGGTSLSAVTVALVGALAVRGYRLTGTEAGQLLRGELSDALALAYDQLAAVTRHADDDDGDGVVADVVRVLRSPGVAGLAKAAKSRVMTVAVQTCAAHDVADGDVRIRAALAPTPPTTPTGTDGAPRAGTPATSAGGSVAPAESAGATMRLAPEAARTRDEWREYLEGKSSRTEIENAVRKYGRLSSDLVELAGWRLQAITPATQSGYRTPLRIHQLDVAAWAEEGPRKAAAQRRAAATVTAASQLGKAA